MTRAARIALVLLWMFTCLVALEPPAASAAATGTACKVVRAGSGVAGKACDLLGSPGRLFSAGKNLITGHLGKAFKDIFGGGGSAASTASTALALTAVVAWAVGGAKRALDETAKLINRTTRPQLRSSWFSAVYWRMTAISALLTLPFLFAAAVQALMRSDLALLARAAFGYLPLAMLAVGVAAPLTMLLLAATDQLCAIVSSAGEDGGARFLANVGAVYGAARFAGAPFITFLLAAITAGGALMLWLELAVREAAVYVIVLMLPLAFAALVWPARRVWAVRAVEVLVALILSKFAIVAVLGLAGAALGQAEHGGLSAALAGTVLVLLGAFAPWAVLRLAPLSELASGALASLRPELEGALRHGVRTDRPLVDEPPAREGLGVEPPGAQGGPRASAHAHVERLAEQGSAGGRTEARSAADAPSANGNAAATAPDIGGDVLVPQADSGHAPGVAATPPAAHPAEPIGATSTRATSAKGNEEVSESPPLVLGPEMFDKGKWVGPVFDLLSGEPGSPLLGNDEEPLAGDERP